MEFQISNGLISKTAVKPKVMVGRTDFLHILKQMMDRVHVTYTDECCPDSGFSPVRRNNTDNTLEFFDYETLEWEEYVPTP